MSHRYAPTEPATFNIWIGDERVASNAELAEINNLDGNPEVFRRHLNRITEGIGGAFTLHDCGHSDDHHGWQEFRSEKGWIASVKYTFAEGVTDPIVWIGIPDIGGDLFVQERRLSEQVAGVKGWMFHNQTYQARGLYEFEFKSVCNQFLTTICSETAIEAANALHVR